MTNRTSSKLEFFSTFEAEPFEHFSRGNRYQRHHNPKIDRVTEAKLDSLAEQVEKLSRTNLALSNFTRRVLHLIPAHLKAEYETQFDSIKSGHLGDQL
jgi:hypothetical protein